MIERSPVIFWILLAATIAVDAVAMTWSYIGSLQHAEELYVALVCGQVSVACIWASFSACGRRGRMLFPFALALVAAAWTGWVHQFERSRDSPLELVAAYFAIWAVQAALLLSALWFMRQTAIGQYLQPTKSADRWRYSVRQLLIVTTAVALLVMILKSAKLVHEVWLTVVIWTVADVGLPIAVLAIRRTRWHALVRLGATAAVAGIVGFAVEFLNRVGEPVAINMIQGLVLFLWLEYGRIVPSDADGDAD